MNKFFLTLKESSGKLRAFFKEKSDKKVIVKIKARSNDPEVIKQDKARIETFMNIILGKEKEAAESILPLLTKKDVGNVIVDKTNEEKRPIPIKDDISTEKNNKKKWGKSKEALKMFFLIIPGHIANYLTIISSAHNSQMKDVAKNAFWKYYIIVMDLILKFIQNFKDIIHNIFIK